MWQEDWDDDCSNEPWDENEWEAFLNKNDERFDQFMDVLYNFMADHPQPGYGDLEAMKGWQNDLRIHLEAEGWSTEDLVLPFLWLDGTGNAAPHDGEDCMEMFIPLDLAIDDFIYQDDPFDGELFDEEEIDDILQLPVYQQAIDLADEIMCWADDVPTRMKDPVLVQFCALVTRVPANIAKGYSIGYDLDMIGGNIACLKRSLKAANSALDLLPDLKDESYMTPKEYRRFYERTYELRNAVGIYIQDLRADFENSAN